MEQQIVPISSLKTAVERPELRDHRQSAPSINFKAMIQDAIAKVDGQQKQAEALTSQLMTGQIEDIHQVMIAGQQAHLSLQLTVQIRNKVIEAYEEMMRMQV